jgi:hypothetical protein
MQNKIRVSNRKGVKLSKKVKERMSLSKIKRRNRLGYVNSIKTRKKMSKYKKKLYYDKTKHPRWKGGISKLTFLQRSELKAGRRKPRECELCGKYHKRICFDHCHKTGKFRGWICDRCNHVIAMIETTDKNTLKIMFKYIKDNEK